MEPRIDLAPLYAYKPAKSGFRPGCFFVSECSPFSSAPDDCRSKSFETYISAECSRSQTPPRLPGAQSHDRWPHRSCPPPGAWAQASFRLIQSGPGGNCPTAPRGQYQGMKHLKKRKDFLAAARGWKWVMPGLVLQARQNRDAAHAEPRVGFTASRRVGGAVARNRAKRRLREVARAELAGRAREGFDYVVIARKAALMRPYGDLLDDLKTAVARLHAKARRN